MAPLPQAYRGFVEKVLQGDFNLLTDDLYIRLYASTLELAARDVTDTPTALGAVTGQVVSEAIATGDRSLTYDVDTHTVMLEVSPAVSTTVGGTTVFRYGLLVLDDGVDEWALVLIDFEANQTLLTGTHSLDLASLLEVRLFSALEPLPIGVDVDPLILVDTDDVGWRVFADGTTMVITTTSDVVTDDPIKWLTAPDAGTWKLVVSTLGVVTAVTGTPAGPDTVYDSVTPLIVPAVDPSERYELTVSNVGVLALVLA